jgi:DNA-binding protein H-NS
MSENDGGGTSRLNFSQPTQPDNQVDMSQDTGEGQATAPPPIPEQAEEAINHINEANVMDSNAHNIPEESVTPETVALGQAVTGSHEAAEAASDIPNVTAADLVGVTSGDAGKVPSELPKIGAKSDADVAKAIAERNKLDEEITNAQKAQRGEVLAQIKNVIETYKIPLAEVGEYLGIKGTRKGSKAKAKYKNPADGKLWSGRGKEPLWIKGQDRNKFLIT